MDFLESTTKGGPFGSAGVRIPEGGGRPPPPPPPLNPPLEPSEVPTPNFEGGDRPRGPNNEVSKLLLLF